MNLFERDSTNYFNRMDRPCKACGKPSFPFDYCYDCMFKKPMRGPKNKERIGSLMDNRRKLI